MTGRWVPHDTRDSIVDYLKHWSERAELPTKRLLFWLGLPTSKYHSWKHRYGKANEHNGQIPRDWWIEDWEKQAIVDYHDKHPLEGYRGRQPKYHVPCSQSCWATGSQNSIA